LLPEGLTLSLVTILSALANPQTCAAHHAQWQEAHERGRGNEGLTVFVTGVEADGAGSSSLRKERNHCHRTNEDRQGPQN
jgi:hypothetical protein